MSRFQHSRGRHFHDRTPFVQGYRQYEEQQSPDYYRYPPPPPKHTPSRRGRDQKRQDAFRENVGQQKAKELQEQLDKDLFFGFSYDSKAMESQKVTVTPQAQIVPVTTRGIGFAAHSLFVRISSTIRNLPPCTVYQLYRVALAQFEFRVSQSLHNNYLPTTCPKEDYVQPIFSTEMTDLLLSIQVNFNLIANIINAAGVFSFDVTYYPRIPNLPNHPCCLTTTNLRATVVALANPRFDRAERVRFYQNNPIPGAIWQGVVPPSGRRLADFEIDPILANPNQIMPARYTPRDLQKDIAAMQDLLDVCARKKSKYVNLDVKINYSSPGQKTLLTSNKMRGDLRILQPSVNRENVIDWKTTDLPSGSLNEFWCSVPIEPTAMFVGALQLMGEVPDPGPPEPGIFSFRREFNGLTILGLQYTPT